MFRRAMEREFEIVGEALKRIRDEEESIYDSITHAFSIRFSFYEVS
jgi:uncharacterized protein with HEPN domain